MIPFQNTLIVMWYAVKGHQSFKKLYTYVCIMIIYYNIGCISYTQ